MMQKNNLIMLKKSQLEETLDIVYSSSPQTLGLWNLWNFFP